ncbi:MAG: ISAzo13 family transposase [Candidatus Levyibacteriota bacterium]
MEPREAYAIMLPKLNEKQRRHYLAVEAMRLGYGGISAVSHTSGVSRVTITAGIQELENNVADDGRVRKKGGGRKKVTKKMPQIVDAIELEANTKTDKRTIVKWTSHSLVKIMEAVKQRGFPVGEMTIWRTLKDLGYALKANKKDIEGGSDHPDRDAQFQHINMMGLTMQIQGYPILSIDCKKTEKIGNMKNNGQEWTAKGEETNVNVYDFGEKESEGMRKGKIKKAIPYGIYDVLKKAGFISVGIDHNTAEFAVASLIKWWDSRGKQEYPEAKEILLFADCGSSNGNRNKLWKMSLQQFANHTGLTIHVCHYPPGTSKWNAIEHELFSFITINWRAKPLVAYETVLELIRHTTTKTGLKVEAYLDENEYKTGKKFTDNDIDKLSITGDAFHPDWNYTVIPQT